MTSYRWVPEEPTPDDSDAGRTPRTSAQFAKLEGRDTRSVDVFWFHETRVLMCSMERDLADLAGGIVTAFGDIILRDKTQQHLYECARAILENLEMSK